MSSLTIRSSITRTSITKSRGRTKVKSGGKGSVVRSELSAFPGDSAARESGYQTSRRRQPEPSLNVQRF